MEALQQGLGARDITPRPSQTVEPLEVVQTVESVESLVVVKSHPTMSQNLTNQDTFATTGRRSSRSERRHPHLRHGQDGTRSLSSLSNELYTDDDNTSLGPEKS